MEKNGAWSGMGVGRDRLSRYNILWLKFPSQQGLFTWTCPIGIACQIKSYQRNIIQKNSLERHPDRNIVQSVTFKWKYTTKNNEKPEETTIWYKKKNTRGLNNFLSDTKWEKKAGLTNDMEERWRSERNMSSPVSEGKQQPFFICETPGKWSPVLFCCNLYSK